MATPERQQPHNSPTDLKAALTKIERQLELADGNENTIERYPARDRLLEQRDLLEGELPHE